MEPVSHVRPGRARRNSLTDTLTNGRPHSRNKHWNAADAGQRNSLSHSDNERWERGGHRDGRGGRGINRGRKFPNATLRNTRHRNVESPTPSDQMHQAVAEHADEEMTDSEDRLLETAEDREKFYQELIKAREVERKRAIAEGKMDDPNVPKRLEDAICIVGTCLDMCPRFERYRRERENNLFEWESIPGTKRVDHKRAVKMYERAAGDKTLPSDLRPPHILKKTLDYLFHDLLPKEGFSRTFSFIRDRSRAVRNDFTMQHNYGPIAIECHDRCARFHILALHFERDRPDFSIALEEQQLMNTLQSLKEFYEDQRGRYESPTELEMRVYHRLIHMRDQKERHEEIPEHISSNPVFQLATEFRLHVQRRSAPINKTSPLVVDQQGMQIFGNLAQVLREQGNVVMIYLVACILERHFGKDAIEDIENIKGDLSVPDIIDGVSHAEEHIEPYEEEGDDEMGDELTDIEETTSITRQLPPSQLSIFGSQSIEQHPPSTDTQAHPSTAFAKPGSAFSSLTATPNAFGVSTSFGASTFEISSSSTMPSAPAPTTVFGTTFGVSQTATAIVEPSAEFPPSTSFKPLEAPNGQSAFGSSTSVAPLPPSESKPSSVAPATFGFSQPMPPEEQVNGTVTASTMPGRGLASPAVKLNPNASAFTPKSIPTSSTPSAIPATFQRSVTPSPSPFISDLSVPPTPLPELPSSTPPSTKPTSVPIAITQRKNSIPPALKINTNTTMTPTQPTTPVIPPLLPKQKPIPLPVTPTGITPGPSIPHLNSLRSTPSFTNNEILSPLYIPSPTLRKPSIHNFTAIETPKKAVPPGPKPSAILVNDIKPPAHVIPKPSREELKEKAAVFARKGVVVRQCFRAWKERATDRAAWLEACRQSEEYRKKVQREKLRASPVDKKRRISTGSVSTDQQRRKRARKRISDYQPPRTDEELAKRFKENHEEHERRWAPGSFLQVIRRRIVSREGGAHIPPSWRIWISLNPEADATAIWLEKKFNIPSSGTWISENVFSIPLSSSAPDPPVDSPGLIVFECTPLEGTADELERKFRILEDCARLRDVVKSFPADRHFTPSLLVIYWADKEQAESVTDFTNMIDKLVQESTVGSYCIFSVTDTTKDLDSKLGEAMSSLPLDLQGKLVRILTFRNVIKLFEPSFMSFVSEWIDNCSNYGEFDWTLYAQVVHATACLINATLHPTSELTNRDTPELLPVFEADSLTNSNTAYETTVYWLSSAVSGQNSHAIIYDLQSRHDMGQDFPARTFLEQLWNLAVVEGEACSHHDPDEKFFLARTELDLALDRQKFTIREYQMTLSRALNMRLRRSPRRRSLSESSDVGSIKRRRVTPSADWSFTDLASSPTPSTNGHDLPSPTTTSASLPATESSPVVSAAMLRALTRELRKKYTAS